MAPGIKIIVNKLTSERSLRNGSDVSTRLDHASHRLPMRDQGSFALFTNPPLAGAASVSFQYLDRECNCLFFFISTKFNGLIFNTEYAA